MQTDWIEGEIKKLEKVARMKPKMLERSLKQAKTYCPCVGDDKTGDATLIMTVSGRRNHIRAWCSLCKFRMIE